MNNKVKYYYMLGVSIKELSVLYGTSISEIANILDLANLSVEEIHIGKQNVNTRITIELIAELNEIHDRLNDSDSVSHVLYLRSKRKALQAALEKLA